jgi:hypothetical protein
VFARLTLLQTQRQKAQADSDFSSRFRFNLKEEKRLRILGKISLYNVKIAQLLDYSTPSPVCIEESIKRPSKQSRQRRLRPVMHNLYKAMGKRWPCGDCGKLHQARLCLLKCQSGSDSSKGATDKMYFNMLTSIHRDASSDFCTWVENKICVALDS